MVPARKSQSVDMQSKSSGIQDVSEDVEARNRGSNVVARLMGLDALPRQHGTLHPPKKRFEERISQQWQEGKLPQGSKLPPKVQTSAKILLHPEVDEHDEILSTKSLSFRDHPQERQLQEFKKHFRARQALQARERLQPEERSEQPVSNQEKTIFAAKKFANLKQISSKLDFHESKEFQDAVEFLHSNKEFFLKFLQEPNSSSGKHHENFAAPEARRPIKMKQMTKPVAGQIVKEFPEHRREASGPESFIRQPKVYGESKLTPKKQGGMPMQRPMGTALDRGRGAGAPNVAGQNRQEHPVSANTKNSTMDNNPTRIVVLKPNPGKSSQVRVLPPSSHSPRVSASNRDTKVYASEPRKERDRTRQSDLQVKKEERRISKEVSKDRMKVLPKDPRLIAREIATQVRDSVAKETDKSFASNEGMLSARLLDSGHRLNQVKTGTYSTVTESSDREVASAPASRRHVRDCPPTVSSSQPTSPCMSKTSAAAPSITSKEGKFQLMEKLRVFQIRGSEESLKETHKFSRNFAQMKPSKPPIMRSPAHSRNIMQLGKDFVDYPDNLHFDAGICSDGWSRASSFSKSSVILNNATSSDLYTRAEDESSNLATTFTSPNASSHTSSADDSSEGEAHINIDYKQNRNRLKVSMERASMESTKDFFRKTALTESLSYRCPPLSVKGLQPSKKVSRQFGMPDQHFAPMELTPNVSSRSGFSDTQTTCYSRAKNDDKRMTGKHYQSVESSSQNLSILQKLHTEKLKEADVGMEHQHDARENPSTEGNIQAKDQSSTRTKLWSLTPEALNKVDNTSEITSEKSEQPSPISVLDSLFDESPPGNSKEGTSELQELNLRLHFLKLDEQHLSRLEARRSIEAYKLDADSKKDEIPPNEALGNIHIQASDEKRRVPSILELSPELSLKNSWMENLSCPKGREEELMYFKKVILIFGLNEHNCAKYPLRARSLDVAPFKTLEDPIVLSALIPSDGKMEQKATVNRQLLFDFVRETVLSQLRVHSNSHPWIVTGRGSNYSKPNLKEVLKQAWIQILQHNEASYQESNSSLGHFVEKDLKKDQWMQVKDEIADIGDRLETLILCDLLEDATMDIVSCKKGFI
ncbi:hypothetical protein O6H91_04G057500 [Diphasiastrum complanatum]|nr:hypothetical protein O6H91_04G057500 [Diphasiastrum complanatum]